MSDMYACNNCKHAFRGEDGGTLRDCVGEYMGQPAYLDYLTCPECGCDDLEEAEQCDGCKEWFHPDAVYHTSVGTFCEECTMDIYEEFKEIKEGAKK